MTCTAERKALAAMVYHTASYSISPMKKHCQKSEKINAATTHSGFIMLALLIFIAMVALVLTSVASNVFMSKRRTAEVQLVEVGRQYRRAIQLYVENTPLGQKKYPPTLGALIKDPRYPDVRRYLRATYPDPITNKYDWSLIIAPDGGIMGIHSASTERPIRRYGYEAPFESFNQAEHYSDWQFFYFQ
ncbi:type II secretory pathway pseudopilin PulG [Oxalobacteraceae bacterium GrIS 1.18]